MKYWKILGLALLLAACQQNDESPKAETLVADSFTVKSEGALPKGVTLLEEVARKGDEIVIPYKKYQLDNGLTVVIHEDLSDPLVHVDVTYHVGSAREEVGKSGFAHFFEHMMFQGSEHVGDEQHFKIVSESGGTLNGTTNSDRTNYFQTVPVNQLEKMLWLEADRMGFLLNAVTQEKFEVQRETVKNERGQNVDNRPYGRASETVAAALYPEGHPYSWPVIGFIEDLNRVNVNDLKKFFLRWYGPNNATLTIGGAIDANETLALVTKYFGSIPRGPEVTNPEKTLRLLGADRYISMEDNVHLPLVWLSFPTVYARHEDEAALDLLAEIIGGGKTSILYKNLVKNGIAVQSSVSHGCQELACAFNMYALPNPRSGKTLADVEATIRASFKEFEARGVTADDLLKVKAKNEAAAIFGLQSVRGKVAQLAAYQTFTGNPNFIRQDIERYRSVTKDDVMRVYNTYLKNKHSVVLSVVPTGKLSEVAAKDSYQTKIRNFLDTTSTSEGDLDIRVAKDSLDRSVQPAAGKNPLVSLPEYWKAGLDNGIAVLGSVSKETPTTNILLKIPAGHFANTIDKAGLSSLTASLMNESTLKRSNENMSLELQKLGSNISVSSGKEYINVFVSSLSKNLSATLLLMEEKLSQPAFNEADFQRLKAQTIQSIQNAKKDPSSLAREGWAKLLYGSSIAGLPESGLMSSISALSVADTKRFYQDFIKPEGAQLIVVSDLSQKDVIVALKSLDSWKGKPKSFNRVFKSATFDPKTIYIVNKDQAAQSVIRIGKRGMPKDFVGEFYKAKLMNFNLGGAFNSRINLNLREDKGYSYGAFSSFWGRKEDGGFIASANVRADVTDKSFVEFIKEISNYQEAGMSSDELMFMRKAVGQRDALNYETPRQKLSFLANILEYRLPTNFVEKQALIINNSSLEELNLLAKKHLDVDTMAKLIVGDANALTPEFEALGYKVQVIELFE